MKKCKNCGVVVKVGTYCPQCGGRLKSGDESEGNMFSHSFPYSGGTRAFADRVGSVPSRNEVDELNDLLLGTNNVFRIDVVVGGLVVVCTF